MGKQILGGVKKFRQTSKFPPPPYRIFIYAPDLSLSPMRVQEIDYKLY